MSDDELQAAFEHALKMDRLYPGLGWWKKAARINRAIMEREAARLARRAA